MREIGASWMRSLRPKITMRRRSLRNDEALVALRRSSARAGRRARLDLLGGVRRLAGLAERLLVDVGRVDLHALA